MARAMVRAVVRGVAVAVAVVGKGGNNEPTIN
jgi:hypothetical protein